MSHKNYITSIVSYPVYMLLADKPSLIVGGGGVAQRKVEKLISSGAKVTVIAKSFTSKLKSLADSGKIILFKREFKITDIKKTYRLIFTTTDDFALNKKITEVCNAKGIMICSVDANWIDGAFLTPASFSKDGLTVAVASDGRSCRRSKFIKENIYRHFTALELSELIIIGMDHSTLSLKDQANLHPDAKQQQFLAKMLNGISAIHEFFILNTCNRFEVIALAHNSKPVIATILKLMGLDHLSSSSYYIHSGYDAFKHTSLMLSGVLSQNVGETYIVAQVKDAIKSAKKNNNCDGIIQDWIDKSLHISKDIRNNILLFEKKEIDELVQDYLVKSVKNPIEKTVAIFGTGKIGTALYSRLSKMDIKKIFIFYRTRKPIMKIRENTEIMQISELDRKLSCIDIVITALNTTTSLITSETKG